MAKNHYTDEFKQQIVGLYKMGQTPEQLVNDYQIGKSTVCKWAHQFSNSGSFKAKDNRTLEENEIIQLRKKVKLEWQHFLGHFLYRHLFSKSNWR
ncbi:transposase [Spiroplasma endosymbiont of Poecilobothrus nobilitatus]|uniref:transposase n=1 Tax=Spiroplasma endosymbiont of Poecilobothrus nobilitatus TaxID=1209220 RepID=UPI00313E4ECF